MTGPSHPDRPFPGPRKKGRKEKNKRKRDIKNKKQKQERTSWECHPNQEPTLQRVLKRHVLIKLSICLWRHVGSMPRGQTWEEHGVTIGCAACSDFGVHGETEKPHTEECRTRMASTQSTMLQATHVRMFTDADEMWTDRERG